MNTLDDQNRLRLMTLIRCTKQVLDLLPLEVAQSIRARLHAPVANLQIDVGIPLDDQEEIRP
jgi:hypothetical protein